MRIAWNEVYLPETEYVANTNGIAIPVTTIGFTHLSVDFPSRTIRGVVSRWGHATDVRDNRPGIDGHENYRYTHELLTYVPSGTAVAADGEWQMVAAESASWPQTATLTFYTNTKAVQDQLDQLILRLPITIRLAADRWADYELTEVSRGTTTDLMGTLIESRGDAHLRTGSQGTVYWAPAASVIRKVYAPDLSFFVQGNDFEQIFLSATPWVGPHEAGDLRLDDLLAHLFVHGHLKSVESWK